jgi:hypothetical protein
MFSRTIIIVLLCSFLEGCGSAHFPIQEVRYNDVNIVWYWEEVGWDGVRDVVEVSKGFKHEVVLECTRQLITDLEVVHDSIVIKTTEPVNGIYASRNSGLGIPVRIDTTATEYEYNQRYHPEYFKKK